MHTLIHESAPNERICRVSTYNSLLRERQSRLEKCSMAHLGTLAAQIQRGCLQGYPWSITLVYPKIVQD